MKLSPLRAAARIAWRQARRAPWRSVLIVTTVALPIAGLTTAAVVIRTALPTTQERIVDLFGTSDIIVEQARDLSPEDLARVLPAGTTIVQRRFVSTENIVGGSRIYTWFEEYSVPIDRAPVSGMFEIMSGRAPTAAGEAAVAPEVLTAFHAEIGDEITFDDVGLTVRVVGTTVDPEQMGEPVGALGPGTLASLSRRTEDGYLIDLPASASLSASIEALQKDGQLDGGYEDPSLVMQDYASEGSVATRGTFAATALLLLGTALIAGAAFAVGAQRQLRTLGLIGAAGGEPRHVRTTVLFGGVSLGVLGSLVGVGVGVLGAYALHPYLDRLANRIVGPVAIPFIPLLGAVALGTSAATLAAYGPARAAARLSTLEALAGRTRPPRAPGKIAGLGLIALAVGGVVTTVGTRSSSDPWLAIGLVVMILGFLAAIPLMVSAVGKQAGQLPTIPRLATRDIARNGRRTAAALAAATIVLALPVSVSALTLSDEAAEHLIPPMAADNLGIESLGRTGSAWQDRAQALAEDLRIAFPNALVAPYRPAVKVVPRDGHEKERSVTVFGPEETATQGGTRYSYLTWGQLVIGDADLLRAFHAEDGIQALNEGKIVGIGPGIVLDGTVRITTHPGGEDPDPGSSCRRWRRVAPRTGPSVPAPTTSCRLNAPRSSATNRAASRRGTRGSSSGPRPH